jgi:hypothetical protein
MSDHHRAISAPVIYKVGTPCSPEQQVVRDAQLARSFNEMGAVFSQPRDMRPRAERRRAERAARWKA